MEQAASLGDTPTVKHFGVVPPCILASLAAAHTATRIATGVDVRAALNSGYHLAFLLAAIAAAVASALAAAFVRTRAPNLASTEAPATATA